MAPVASAEASARVSAYSAVVRSSRARASRSCRRSRAASSLITQPTPNIIAKVSTYERSDTANVKYGGTKKKS